MALLLIVFVVDSFQDGTWTIDVENTQSGSSANEEEGVLMFSPSHSLTPGVLITGSLAWSAFNTLPYAHAQQCDDSAEVTLTLPAGWAVESENDSEFAATYTPRSWGYNLEISLPSESVSSFSDEDEALFLANLVSSIGSDWSKIPLIP